MHRHPGVVAAEVDGLSDVGVGFFPSLADLVALQGGHVVSIIFDGVGQLLQQLGALTQGGIAPGGPGGSGFGDGGVDVGAGGQRDLGDFESGLVG